MGGILQLALRDRFTILNAVFFFFDEAWFHRDCFINAQNYRLWSSENPHCFCTTLLHSQKTGVRVAISWKRIIGPFFFSTTITGKVYGEIVQQFIVMLDVSERDIVFQQDNVRPHVAKETMEMLQKFFGESIVKGSPRSPDLSPLTYFLWGHLKNTVYKIALTTMEPLKNKIEEEMNKILQIPLKHVFKNLRKRATSFKQANSLQFKHLKSRLHLANVFGQTQANVCICQV